LFLLDVTTYQATVACHCTITCMCATGIIYANKICFAFSCRLGKSHIWHGWCRVGTSSVFYVSMLTIATYNFLS